MELWRWKTVALFDVWSIEHFLTGVTVGAVVLYLSCKKPHSHLKFLMAVLAVAYAWEFVEYNLEMGRSGIEAVTYWFQGVEYWPNRLGSDPALVLLGAFVALRFEKVRLPARMTSFTWMGAHVLVFPHCMYLHTLF